MVVVTGRRNPFGVYGKGFTGEALMASRLHLLSFSPWCLPPCPPHPLLPGSAPSCSGQCRCPRCCPVCPVAGQGPAWPLPPAMGGLSSVLLPPAAQRLGTAGGLKGLNKALMRVITQTCSRRVLLNSCPSDEVFLRTLPRSGWKSSEGLRQPSCPPLPLLGPGWPLGLGCSWRAAIPPGHRAFCWAPRTDSSRSRSGVQHAPTVFLRVPRLPSSPTAVLQTENVSVLLFGRG